MNFKKAKMTVVPQKNPFPNPVVGSDAAITFSPFVVRQNKGSGPQGQTSKAQIKKVPFKGVKKYTSQLKNGGLHELTKRSMGSHERMERLEDERLD